MSLTGQVYPSVQFNEEYVKSKSKDTTGAITTNNKAAVNESGDLNAKITKQGELVRDLKAKKASKEEVTKEVGVLLALKAEFKTLTGEEWKPSTTPDAALAPAVVTSSAASKAEKAPKPEKPKQEPKPKKQPDEKKQTRLGLEAKKEENLPDWYSQVINFFDFSAVFDHLNY